MNGKGSVAWEWAWWYSRRADGQRRVNAPVRGKKKTKRKAWSAKVDASNVTGRGGRLGKRREDERNDRSTLIQCKCYSREASKLTQHAALGYRITLACTASVHQLQLGEVDVSS